MAIMFKGDTLSRFKSYFLFLFAFLVLTQPVVHVVVGTTGYTPGRTRVGELVGGGSNSRADACKMIGRSFVSTVDLCSTHFMSVCGAAVCLVVIRFCG